MSTVGDSETIVYENGLDPCRPNPFNPHTSVSYRLAEAGEVSLRIYDVSGRLVTTLVEGRKEAGQHEVSWDGLNADGNEVASAVYYVRFETAGFSQVRTMTLLR